MFQSPTSSRQRVHNIGKRGRRNVFLFTYLSIRCFIVALSHKRAPMPFQLVRLLQSVPPKSYIISHCEQEAQMLLRKPELRPKIGHIDDG